MQQSGIDPTKMDLPALFQRQMPAYLRKLKASIRSIKSYE